MKEFCTLDFWKQIDKKANYHTHTTRCQHALGTEREYIEKAIEAGYEILGFSDHAPHIFEDGYVSAIRMKMSELDGYVSTLEKLRKEYEKDIQIYIGLEVEYLPKRFETSLKHYQEYPLDYMILGQHFVDDEGPGMHVQIESSDVTQMEAYMKRMVDAVDTGYFMYVAHPDIFNYVGDSAVYDQHMNQLIQELKKRNIPIEINCGGYRVNKHYPRARFMELAAKQGCDFIVGIDAHEPDDMVNYQSVEACAEMAQKFGGRVLNL